MGSCCERFEPDHDGKSNAVSTHTGGTLVLWGPREQIAREDGAPTDVQVGDTFEVAYGPGQASDDVARDWAFIVNYSGAEAEQASRQDVENAPMPTQFALGQNRPNPFSAATAINFELPRAVRVKLSVFDLQGRLLG